MTEHHQSSLSPSVKAALFTFPVLALRSGHSVGRSSGLPGQRWLGGPSAAQGGGDMLEWGAVPSREEASGHRNALVIGRSEKDTEVETPALSSEGQKVPGCSVGPRGDTL